MRFNSKFEKLYNMIMESFRDPNDPYEDDEHEKIISGIKRNAKNPAILNNIRKEFKDSRKYADLNDPIHVERLKKIVQDEISSFNFPPGKRIFPTYAYQKTIYELEKRYRGYGGFQFTFNDFKSKLIDVINNKVHNDGK